MDAAGIGLTMDISRASDAWWKNAVFYCLDVETFQDSNGDGIGDFAGLARRLDHLDRLGVTCIWLMPFHPSPSLDDGYDITDYYAVDPRLGTLGDFVEFLRAARDRGIRVIADLVVNHTSREHPWFVSARSDRKSPYRDWYVWRDEPLPEAALFALRHDWEGRMLRCLANLGPGQVSAVCTLPDAARLGRPQEILGTGRVTLKKAELTVELPGYGLRWLRFGP